MVEDSEGGVVLIGGERRLGDGTTIQIDSLFHLSHAGQNSSWVELPQKVKTARNRYVALMVPDSLTNCN